MINSTSLSFVSSFIFFLPKTSTHRRDDDEDDEDDKEKKKNMGLLINIIPPTSSITSTTNEIGGSCPFPISKHTLLDKSSGAGATSGSGAAEVRLLRHQILLLQLQLVPASTRLQVLQVVLDPMRCWGLCVKGLGLIRKYANKI